MLIPFGPGSAHPGIYPIEVYTKILENVHTRVFLAALFVQKETGNLKYPSVGRLANKSWVVHTLE